MLIKICGLDELEITERHRKKSHRVKYRLQGTHSRNTKYIIKYNNINDNINDISKI